MHRILYERDENHICFVYMINAIYIADHDMSLSGVKIIEFSEHS